MGIDRPKNLINNGYNFINYELDKEREKRFTKSLNTFKKIFGDNLK